MLLIDIGNTRVKWASWHHQEIVDSHACRHDVFHDVLQQFSMPSNWQPKQALVCSVSSQDNYQRVCDSVEKRFGLHCRRVKVSKSAGGLVNGYTKLSNLGADRWVAAIGARHLEPRGDLIVIDAGTAITIDWVSADNVFEGGVILPGQKTMHDSLVGQTAEIESELLDVYQIIGKDTKECVNSGISYGVVGAIERIVSEMQKAIGHQANIIMTGGGMSGILARTSLSMKQEPNLVLLGLAAIAGEV